MTNTKQINSIKTLFNSISNSINYRINDFAEYKDYLIEEEQDEDLVLYSLNLSNVKLEDESIDDVIDSLTKLINTIRNEAENIDLLDDIDEDTEALINLFQSITQLSFINYLTTYNLYEQDVETCDYIYDYVEQEIKQDLIKNFNTIYNLFSK